MQPRRNEPAGGRHLPTGYSSSRPKGYAVDPSRRRTRQQRALRTHVRALRLESSLSNWSGGRPGPAVRGLTGSVDGRDLARQWRAARPALAEQALPPYSVDHDMKRHVLEGSDQCHGRREFLLASYQHVLCFAARSVACQSSSAWSHLRCHQPAAFGYPYFGFAMKPRMQLGCSVQASAVSRSSLIGRVSDST